MSAGTVIEIALGVWIAVLVLALALVRAAGRSDVDNERRPPRLSRPGLPPLAPTQIKSGEMTRGGKPRGRAPDDPDIGRRATQGAGETEAGARSDFELGCHPAGELQDAQPHSS